MAIDMEKAGVTELYVRMDCNGCVQKIKKAIHTIDGVRDINVDIHQQKITVVGGADPELLVKAIKKTKKTATICSHAEPASQPPSESPPAEATPPAEPPKKSRQRLSPP
ncbi:heavy metal-associated isoprenylated plant protein 5-like isoform X1 [Iris pallida]|uniref:Heavy metal-associated isoprenylated plant protein 5-like isoform X1 n=1 Tax=Iris pallida TaxID=29817 RepID=A0AAX6DPQ2_IRIPA|nr:heavy metal-associated isoprenylated plant protein 5-like isoform X1 [Iris pallida]